MFSDEKIKRMSQAVAIAVAKGNGFTILKVKPILKGENSEEYKRFQSILKNKWHINIVPIEGDVDVFIIDSYGEKHISRIIKKSQEKINEYKTMKNTLNDLFNPETILKFLFK